MEFKSRYNKNYNGKELEKARFNIFKQNMEMMKLMQRTDHSATYSYLTPFMDLSPEEFMNRSMTYEPIQRHESNVKTFSMTDNDLPSKFDWTEQGVVNSPRDQGSCGSCWAHAIVEGLESSYAIKHDYLYELSPQQLVDCDSNDAGCDGGNLTLGEDYCKRNSVVQEQDYPYVGLTQSCKINGNGVVKAKEYGIVRGGEDAMRQYLIEHGPLPIALNANPVQFYSSGVLDPTNCNKNALNHAVLLVGYDIEADVPYWKIMNSWGSSWGEDGFFRISYGKNTCGLANDVTYIDAE